MIYIISFLFGIIFGSFISVLVHRIKNNEKGIFLGRSKCPSCNHTLSSLDLVPIFSYIFLKGKCRYCKANISVIYPILELVTGLLFVLASLFLVKYFGINYIYENIYILLYLWLIVIFVVAISFYDILFYELSFILVGILAVLLLIPQILGYIGNFKESILLGVGGFMIFVSIIYLRGKIRKIEGMGGGDAIGAIIIAFFVPILIDILQINSPSWLVYYICIMLGFITAGIVGIVFILLGKGKQFALPFLPFMFLGLIIFIIFGKDILAYIVN